jgi:hypothetical protein
MFRYCNIYQCLDTYCPTACYCMALHSTHAASILCMQYLQDCLLLLQANEAFVEKVTEGKQEFRGGVHGDTALHSVHSLPTSQTAPGSLIAATIAKAE